MYLRSGKHQQVLHFDKLQVEIYMLFYFGFSQRHRSKKKEGFFRGKKKM